MLALESSRRYFLYRGPADMRKGFNGLGGLVRNAMKANPLSGDVFIFVNRRRNRIKLLVWDRTGFVVWYKCLEQGTFEIPPVENENHSLALSWETLVMILEGIELKSIRHRKRYILPKSALMVG